MLQRRMRSLMKPMQGELKWLEEQHPTHPDWLKTTPLLPGAAELHRTSHVTEVQLYTVFSVEVPVTGVSR